MEPARLYDAQAVFAQIDDQAAQLDGDAQFWTTGNYHEDSAGMGEKWFKSSSRTWHFIKPDGTVHRYHGGAVRRAEIVARLDARYHADPTFLMQAAERRSLESAQAVDAHFGLYTTGNLHENSSGLGEKWFKGADRQWYFITSDGTIRHWQRGIAVPDSRIVARVDSSYSGDVQSLTTSADNLSTDRIDYLMANFERLDGIA